MEFNMGFRIDIKSQLADLVRSYARDMKILLVDDNPSDIEFHKLMFGNFFLECDVAHSGKEAYEKFMAKGIKYYDLIVTDVEMPKMSGLELVRLIRNSSLKQSIIVLTGVEDLQTNQDISFYYVDGILPKPIDKQKMYALLYRVLKRVSDEKDYESYVKGIEGDVLHIENTIRNLQIVIEMLSRMNDGGKVSEVLHILHGILSSSEEFIDKKESLRREKTSNEIDLLEDDFFVFEESSVKNELKMMRSGGYLSAKEFEKMQKIDEDLLDGILELFEELKAKGNYTFGLTKDFVIIFKNIVKYILRFCNNGYEFEKLADGLEKLLSVLSSIEKDLTNHQTLRYQIDSIAKSLKDMVDSLFVRKNSDNIHEFDDKILEDIAQIEMLIEQNMG